MKKSIALIVSLAVIAGLAFADDAKVAAPKATPKTEIWGSANLDHFTTGDEVAAGSYGNWYFNKARVGINTQASDTVSFVSEFDLVGLDLRLFNAMWVPGNGLSVTAGKFMENYSQICTQSRRLGLDVDYDFGPGTFGLQVVNSSDITDFAYSNYGSTSSATAGSAVQTAGSTATSKTNTLYGLKFSPTTDIILEPTVSYDVIASENMKLTLGADGSFDYTPATASAAATLVKNADARATLSVGKILTWTNEFFYACIGDSSNNMNFYSKATFTATPSFKPCAYIYMFNLAANPAYTKYNPYNKKVGTQSDTIVLELPYTLAKNFTVNPWGSYAFVGGNKYDLVQNDWSVGLRMSYSFSSKF